MCTRTSKGAVNGIGVYSVKVGSNGLPWRGYPSEKNKIK
jgi:hypothetical protein